MSGAARIPQALTGSVAALALTAALAAPAPAASISWDPSTHPSTSGRTQIFRGATAPAVDDAWAIGYSFGTVGGALEFRTLAQHWNGNSWSVVPTPDVETAPAKDLLFDVSAAAPDDIWTAGLSATAVGNQSSKPLVEHYNGSTWSIVSAPSPPLSTLSAVAAKPGTVWVLGEQYNSQSGYYKPLILRREGSVWTEFPLAATPGCKAAPDGTFYRFEPGGIAIPSHADAYVSGTCSSAGGDRAVLARLRGGVWKPAFDPTTLPVISRLHDVETAPGRRVRAVGEAGTAPLILAGSGLSFHTEAAPTLGTGTSLSAVTSGSGVYAVGVYSAGDAFARPAVYRARAGTWRSEPVAAAYGNPFGIAVDPAGHAWATGVSVTDDRGLILRRFP